MTLNVAPADLDILAKTKRYFLFSRIRSDMPSIEKCLANFM